MAIPTIADLDGLRECVRRIASGQEVPPDYLAVIEHLLRQKRRLDAGVLRPERLLHDEAEGILILQEVLEEGRAGGNTCPFCGFVNSSASKLTCARCHQPLRQPRKRM